MLFKNRKSLLVRFVLILALLGGMFGMRPVQPVQAATLTVINTNDSGPGSLRQAIMNAASSDIITFDPALAGQAITLAANLVINKHLMIDGSGLSPQVTISGGNVAHLEITSANIVRISDVKIANGYTSGAGGAILSYGDLSVVNSTFINNHAVGQGGAIYSAGRLALVNSTIYQNRTDSDGGAIALVGNGYGSTIINSTVSQNQAGSSGGGIIMHGNSTADIFNSTFAGNNAIDSAEIKLISATNILNLHNSVFACTSGTSICYSYPMYSPINGDHSFFGTGTLADFGLAELADSSGPTQTMALLPDSPLIDAGNDANCPSTDQRGVARPQGSHCDIGAYEYEYQSVIHHVKWDASGANNGTSWTDAYTNLQSALAAAFSGDEIWVAAGTYKPTAGTDRTVSFILKSGVAVYGGFAGTETSSTQRNYGTNVTVLSGDIGVLGDNSDNSYHVVIGSGTNSYAKLDGFTITGGNANNTSSPNDRGGGMYNDKGSPALRNVIFSGNYATFGGGMYNGGEYSFPNGSNPSLTNVIFSDNSAIEGGGVRNENYSSPGLLNVSFSNNSAVRSGGGMENVHYSNPVMRNVTFSGNIGGAGGGGMMNWDSSSPILVNVTFHANSATDGGGGIYNYSGSSPWLMNVTFSGNEAYEGGGMYNAYGSDPIVTNSILYGNPGGEIFDVSGTRVVTYSIVQGGYPGTGNLDADPLLGPLQNNGNFTQTMALGAGSPAIDAGTNDNCPASDQRGVTRPQGSHCDIGAYEYQASAISPGDTLRVSVDSSGGQADGYSHGPSISADGRYIAFDSSATNLVTGDTNAADDVFLHDTQMGTTTRLSVDSSGVQGNGHSWMPSISADGRYIAFSSVATNLVSGDTNGASDIFVHDMQTGLTARVSVDSNGVQGNNNSHFPSISANGRYITFMSYATNLVSGDTNGMEDVFVHDLQTGTTRRVSVDSNGAQANSSSYESSISADGRYIAFASYATNLVAGDTNAAWDIFVHNVQTGMTRRISVDSNATQGDGPSNDPSISADGRYTVFMSNATNLVPDDSNGWYDIFMHDIQTGLTTRVSVDSNGGQGNQDSAVASISADGRFIAFRSQATNLVPGDTNGVNDIFVHDIQTGLTRRVSVSTNNGEGNNESGEVSVSADGQFIAFTSVATNLVSGDTNAVSDIFVHRQDMVSIPPTPTPTYTPTQTPSPTATFTPMPTFNPTKSPTASATPPYSYNPLYLSLTANQTIGGVASADEDILRLDGQNWSLFFDGSDVGVGKVDLFGFSILDADTILMSFSGAVTVNGLAITPQDVVRFDATSLGSNTAGTFSMYLDGSDVGLDTTAEKIDSVSMLPDGRVLISTTGNPSVPGVAGRDEDVLAFTPTSLGDATSGFWAMYFDGSDVGLGETSGEDVDALDVVAGKVYLSTADNFSVNGLAGADEDVFVCEPTSLGDLTACNYSSDLYFDGSTWGLSANDVDAFNFLAMDVMPTNTPTPTQTRTPTKTSTPSPTATATFTPTRTTTPPTSMYIRVTQPNGGEVLTVGSTYRITWDSTSDIDTVTIGYKSCESCLDWIAYGIPNAGYYDWNVFVGNTINTQFKIYILGYDTGVGSVSDTSDNNFTVLQPTPTPTVTRTPTATPQFTPSAIPTYISQTPIYTPTSTPDASGVIFADGFESGDLSAWSSSSTDSGDLSVSSAAAVVGTQGMQVLIDDTNTVYVTDDSPTAETRYRARFYFDPNSIAMTSGNAHFIFKGFLGNSTQMLQVELRNWSGAYQLRAKVMNDSSAFVLSNWFTISDGPHFIELDWRAATSAGANNGGLTFWIDGVQQADLTGLDNDTWRIDRVRLGAVAGLDAGTSGSYYFDAFESRRQSYIEP